MNTLESATCSIFVYCVTTPANCAATLQQKLAKLVLQYVFCCISVCRTSFNGYPTLDFPACCIAEIMTLQDWEAQPSACLCAPKKTV